jgi:hypothetical protein
MLFCSTGCALLLGKNGQIVRALGVIGAANQKLMHQGAFWLRLA